MLTHHFRKDASEAPDVDGGGVGLCAEKDLGGSVPQRDDLVRVSPDGQAEGAGQAKVGELEYGFSLTPLTVLPVFYLYYLDGAAVVDEKILRLEVAVEHAVGVAVGDAGQQLMHVALKSEAI